MLSDEMRKLLLHGPGRPPSHANLLKYGGSATLLVQWRKHRQELLDACTIGSRPRAFFAIERRFGVVPRLEADQLRAIRTLGCYRDEAEGLCAAAAWRDERGDARPPTPQPRRLAAPSACPPKN